MIFQKAHKLKKKKEKYKVGFEGLSDVFGKGEVGQIYLGSPDVAGG